MLGTLLEGGNLMGKIGYIIHMPEMCYLIVNFTLRVQYNAAVTAAACQTSSLSNVISILILLPSVHYILMMNGLKRPLKKVNSWIVLVIVEL